MPEQPRSERKTQNRVIQLFTGPDGLGYNYLGEWNKRESNQTPSLPSPPVAILTVPGAQGAKAVS